MPFGNHLWDLLPLIVLALLFFGPKRLPEIGSSIGKTIKEFQKSMREVKEPDATLPTQPVAQLPQASATQATPPNATPTTSTTATTATLAATETQAPEVSAS